MMAMEKPLNNKKIIIALFLIFIVSLFLIFFIIFNNKNNYNDNQTIVEEEKENKEKPVDQTKIENQENNNKEEEKQSEIDNQEKVIEMPADNKGKTTESIELSSNIINVGTGSGAIGVLTAKVLPSNTLDKKIIWKSSDTNIATVKDGEVTAIKDGTATITATLPNGEKAECVVNVSTKVINVLMVQINISSVTLNVNDTTQLTATVLPSNATNKTITWSSSNTNIVTVDKNGKVTAKAKGSAKIYARSANGVVDDCAIIVK